MEKMTFRGICGVVLALLSGCGPLNQLSVALGGADQAPVSSAPASGQIEALSAGGARTPEALDQSTDAERAVALENKAAGRGLGETVAGLGNPSEPGFWLKTPLVKTETSGQIRDRVTGNSVAVTLIPIAGPETAGSRLSLAAMRALQVNLAGLITLDVSL